MTDPFSGNPRTEWLVSAANKDRKMQLIDAFSYTDKKGDKWSAPACYVIDGASIPRALWTAVGSPYCGMYRRASVVHDKACEDAVGDDAARYAADRMFYRACRDGGCSWLQAKILYIGVRIGANWRAASLLEDDRPAEPRTEEDEVDRAAQQALKAIADDPEVAAAPDDPELLEEAVRNAGRRHLAALPPAAVARRVPWK